MGDWSYSTKPTFSATGKETRKCQNSGCTYSETQTAAKLTKVYLKPNSYWTSDGARFAAYFFNNSTGKNYWVSMTDNDGDGVYEATIPSGTWPNVIFCRMNPGNSTNNWNNKWTQTGDLSLSSSNNLYTLNDGSWDAGKWSTFRALDPITGTLFFTPTAAWKSSCAGGFAAYFFGNGDKWVTMTDADGDGTYECVAPEGFYHVIFVGLKNTTANWDNKAQQTENLRPENGNNHYTLSSKSWSHKHAVKSFDAVAATCEADGYNAYVECTCAYCFYSSKIVINQLGHDMVDATCENPSTCEREGCTHTEGEALGHTGGTAACGARLVCDRCANEYGDPIAHNEVEHEGQAATCTENGWNAYVTCSNCDYTTYSEIKTTGHINTTSDTKAATCTENGYTIVTCSCGTVVYDEIILSTGHTFSDSTCICGATQVVTFEKLTSMSSLIVGTKIVFVYENGSTKNELSGISNEIGTYTSYSSSPKGVLVFEVVSGSQSGAIAFKNGSKYLSLPLEGNKLSTTNSLDQNSSWRVSISNEVVKVFNVQYPNRELQWNASSPRFACYTSTQQAISIYIQTTTVIEKHDCVDYANGATCNANAICSKCGKEIVDTKTAHNWSNADCFTAKTCSVCNTIEGEALGHTTENGVCERCGDEITSEPATPSTLAEFTFGTNGSASHKDGSSNKSTYSETVNGYTLSITGGTNMYPSSYDAKGNSCIKFGASSKAGSCTFTVPENVTEVVIYVAKYKDNTTKITVNGTAYTISSASNNGEYDAIVVDTSVNKTVSFSTVSGGLRCMINTIIFNGIAQ